MSKVKDPFDYVKGKIPRYQEVTNTVLFFDVVGFTKGISNEEMRKIIQKIEDVLTGIFYDDYDWHEKSRPNDLIFIPTGDGYAIGFNSRKFKEEKILSIAIDLFEKLTANGGKEIRMGIAKGPNIRHFDLNQHNNLFGFGINMANRVMSLARENQILVHDDFANEILRSKEIPELIDIGEYEIKHGEVIRVFNFCKKAEFGNETPPPKK